jgi:arylsulfatase A-like enzyme
MKYRAPRPLLAAALAIAIAIISVSTLMMTVTQPGCSGGRKPENVILMTLDTLRADHVSALPGGKASTPALDALAARGVIFENAWSPIPMTLPAHASIFFGQPPHVVANYNNGQVIVSRRNRPSVVNAFRREGFATAAFVSLGVLAPEFGLAEGFDEYTSNFPDNRWYLTAGEVNARVLPWLEAHKDRPFFLWVHFSDPHDPYCPPDMPEDLKLRLNGRLVGSYRLNDYASHRAELDLQSGENALVFETLNPYQADPSQYMARLDSLRFGPETEMKGVRWDQTSKWYVRPGMEVSFFQNGALLMLRTPIARRLTMTFRGRLNLTTPSARDLYRREVEYMDGRIGELLAALDKLGLRDNTAVIAAGDHGEGLGEYKTDFGDAHFGHIHYLQKVYLHVPLIVSAPGYRRNGTRRPEPVTLMDIAPTLLGLLRFKGFDSLPGRNLLALKPGASIPVYMETYRPEAFKNRFALLEAPWHMVFSPEDGHHDLYDLAADPAASVNVWDTPGVPADTSRGLEERLNAFARDILKNKKDIAVDSKAEEMLKSLGYLAK